MRRLLATVISIPLFASGLVGAAVISAAPSGAASATDVLINEVDADQVSTDSAEFVELFDGGDGNTDLTGLVLVLYNGSDDQSYISFDLDGQSTDGDGYFVLCGNAANVANCDLDVSPDTNLIQNGEDAVALLVGDAVDYPNDTALPADGDIVDAIVYETGTDADSGLLVLLNAAQGVVDEGGAGDQTGHSNQRCANGTGGARNTNTYLQLAPTPGAVNTCIVEVPPVATFIHSVQGSGSSVAITGQVSVDAIVTTLFEDDDALDGFFIQEEDADVDADPATSEGIFVFCGSACPGSLAVGDAVTVVGAAGEFFGMSRISVTGLFDSVTVNSSGNSLPTASSVDLPALGATDAEATFEAVEGMLVSFPDKLVVSEYFQLARFGELVLTLDARPFQFTHGSAPSVAGYAAFLADLATKQIILDDNNNDQNDALGPPDEAYYYPEPGLSTGNFFRGGDSITSLTGVMDWSFSAWRVRPIPELYDYTFTAENTRPVAPADPGGSLQVASFNVLNYFTTIDDGVAGCGPVAAGSCRGADSAAEFTRQRDKIIAAVAAIDADIVGLIELENNASTSLSDLVSGLNATMGAGTYDYVDTGFIGTDDIKVGFIYKPATVTAVGDFAILDSSVDPSFIDTKNRPVLIQTFDEIATEGRVTIAVNHLKSKGSSCSDVGDPGTGDGQANCNLTRTSAATALASYLATDPTGSGDDDFLIIGDMNAYAMEDPISALGTAGYTDLISSFNGSGAYSFVFDSQLGYLDHALANGAVLSQVTGVTEWHINADEIPLFDYNDDIQDPSEASFNRESSATTIYEPNAFRSSDHDPLVVGLSLEPSYDCAGEDWTVPELEAAGYNVILGDDSKNWLFGTNGNDAIFGFGGNDIIIAKKGDDLVCAGAGHDFVVAGRGADIVLGQSGNDWLIGNRGDDALNGGDGVDQLFGNKGFDTCTEGESLWSCEA
jgi:predicted extracellular nuclease